MAGDQDVVAADGVPPAFESSADVAGVGGGGLVEGQDFDPRGEALDFLAVMVRTGRFRGAMEQFGEDDGGGAEGGGFGAEAVSELCRAIAEDADAEVRVQEIAKHQKASRSCAFGWSGGARSIPGASKKSSQTALAGTITRRFPSRMIRTSLTVAGKATFLGNKAAGSWNWKHLQESDYSGVREVAKHMLRHCDNLHRCDDHCTYMNNLILETKNSKPEAILKEIFWDKNHLTVPYHLIEAQRRRLSRCIG